jgi:hypothetical protein
LSSDSVLMIANPTDRVGVILELRSHRCYQSSKMGYQND